MNKSPLTDFIQNSIPASSETLNAIAAHFEEKTFLKNEYFLKEGYVSDNYFFLADGCMRAFTFDTDGNEVTTYFYTKNRVVFEASSFFMHTVSTENMRLLAWSESYCPLIQLCHQVAYIKLSVLQLP